MFARDVIQNSAEHRANKKDVCFTLKVAPVYYVSRSLFPFANAEFTLKFHGPDFLDVCLPRGSQSQGRRGLKSGTRSGSIIPSPAL